MRTRSHGKGDTIFSMDLEGDIRLFQSAGDPAYFMRILISIDKLILRMIHQERRKSACVMKMEFDDLYQIGVLSLYEALGKFKIELSSIYSFPRYLQGYLRKNIWKFTKDENRYISCGLDIGGMRTTSSCHEAADKQIDHRSTIWLVEDMLVRLRDSGLIDEQDDGMLRMRYFEGHTYKAISERTGKNEECIKKRISRLRGKMRIFLMNLSRSGSENLFIKEKRQRLCKIVTPENWGGRGR